jgi:biotin synthase
MTIPKQSRNTGEEAAECLACLSRRIASVGFEPDFGRGDHPDTRTKEEVVCG